MLAPRVADGDEVVWLTDDTAQMRVVAGGPDGLLRAHAAAA